MKHLWKSSIILLCCLLTACVFQNKALKNSKNTEYMAMLSDPAIRKDFRQLKNIAMHARLYHDHYHVYFSAEDIKQLDAVSSRMIHRLRYDYHLTSTTYKIHTFIGKNEYHSCYQYYNSYPLEIGKSCDTFSSSFSSCQLCDRFIKTLRSRRFNVIHTMWWNHQKTMDLVDTFQLRNGDPVYVGLSISID